LHPWLDATQWNNLITQLVRTGRRIVYRLLSWNRWLPVFFRALRVLRVGFG